MSEEKKLEGFELDDDTLDEVAGGARPRYITTEGYFSRLQCELCNNSWTVQGVKDPNTKQSCKCGGQNCAYLAEAINWKVEDYSRIVAPFN